MNAIAIILKALEAIEYSDDPYERRIAYVLKTAIQRECEEARKADWAERHKEIECHNNAMRDALGDHGQG